MLSSIEMQKEHYSAVWRLAHYNNFLDIIDNEQVWPFFLSNGIAHMMGAAQNYTDGSANFGDKNKTSREIETTTREFKELCDIAGAEFVQSALQPDIGNSDYVEVADKKIISHDLKLVFNAWRLSEHLSNRREDPLIIAEIGGGYGALVEKLNPLFKNSKIIIFDLPEANAIQTYFLHATMAEKKFFYFEDFKKTGIQGFLDGDYEIALLPSFTADSLSDKSIDLFINIRSMMEMNLKVIKDYFQIIHRTIRDDGSFYCVNRYHKDEVGVPIQIKHYPFDDRWYFTHSAPLWIQTRTHELIANRTEKPVVLNGRKPLFEIYPYNMGEVWYDVAAGFKKLGAIIFGLGYGSGNAGIIANLTGLSDNPDNPLRRCRRWLGRVIKQST